MGTSKIVVQSLTCGVDTLPGTLFQLGLQIAVKQRLPSALFKSGCWLAQIGDVYTVNDFPGGSEGKVSARNVGDLGLITGSGRSPGEGNDNLLQYSSLENPMGGEAWQATIHGVEKSWTQLSNFTFTFFLYAVTVFHCLYFFLFFNDIHIILLIFEHNINEIT